jgi:hypothetical protein
LSHTASHQHALNLAVMVPTYVGICYSVRTSYLDKYIVHTVLLRRPRILTTPHLMIRSWWLGNFVVFGMGNFYPRRFGMPRCQ